jgi:hypothetical protein
MATQNLVGDVCSRNETCVTFWGMTKLTERIKIQVYMRDIVSLKLFKVSKIKF